jgi:hypothetical protein
MMLKSNFNNSTTFFWDTYVSIVMGYGLWPGWSRNQGLIPIRGKRFLSSSQHPDYLWDTPDLSNGYQGLFSQGQSCRSLKLIIHLHIVPKLRMLELYLHSPLRFHGMIKHRDNFTLKLYYSLLPTVGLFISHACETKDPRVTKIIIQLLTIWTLSIVLFII